MCKGGLKNYNLSLCVLILLKYLDFELQAGMVELIVRLLPCASRFTKAPQYFIDKFVSQAFREISMEDFEAVSLRLIFS